MDKFNVTDFVCLFKKLGQCIIRFYINLVENQMNLVHMLKNYFRGLLLHVCGWLCNRADLVVL